MTLSYLSLFPEGVAASFTCGGIPHVPASASEVYAHTFPRMAAKTQQYYNRYPADVERVAALADALEEQKPCYPTLADDGRTPTAHGQRLWHEAEL